MIRVSCSALLCLLALASTSVSPVLGVWETREGKFSGYWTVSGTVHILEFADSRVVGAGRLEGQIVLQSDKGQIPVFETDCVAFSDERTGGISRCVWTDSFGDKVYCELKGQGAAGFGPTRGRFVGGTGRYEGVSGNFSFQWNFSVSRGKDATLDGHSMSLSGSYRLRD